MCDGLWSLMVLKSILMKPTGTARGDSVGGGQFLLDGEPGAEDHRVSVDEQKQWRFVWHST